MIHPEKMVKKVIKKWNIVMKIKNEQHNNELRIMAFWPCASLLQFLLSSDLCYSGFTKKASEFFNLLWR